MGRALQPARERGVPWWGVVAAAGAPVLLIGGSVLGAALQPGAYDQRSETLSALAGEGAADRWVMTGAFWGIGVCYLIAAYTLRQPALPARGAMVVGGLATMLVAAFPQTRHGTSMQHGVVAVVASVTIALWPVLGARRDTNVLWVLRPRVCVVVSTVSLALLAGFAWELHHGAFVGLWERLAASSEAIWLLVAAAALRRADLSAERAASSRVRPMGLRPMYEGWDVTTSGEPAANTLADPSGFELETGRFEVRPGPAFQRRDDLNGGWRG